MRDDPHTSAANAFAHAAPGLLEAGHSPLPLQPGTKKCVEPGWSAYCLKQPSAEQVATWSQRGRAGVGVATGNGLIAVDIDTDDHDIITAIRSVIPESSVAKHGAKGRTDFFFDPTRSLAARRIKDAEGKNLVEILAVGCQTVVPPTLHPITQGPYTYLTSRTLADTRRENLPEVPVDLLARLEVALQGWTGTPSREAVSNQSPGRSIDGRAWALKALENEAAKIALAQPGGRNPQLFSSACAVGRYVHHGLLDEGEFVAAFADACQVNGLLDEDGLRQCRATIQQGLNKARNDSLPDALRQSRSVDPPAQEWTEFAKARRPMGLGHNSGAAQKFATELDMARAFASRHADRIRFDHDQKSWFYWDDDVWTRDQSAYVFNLIQNFCEAHDGTPRQVFSSRRGIQNVEVLIQNQPSIAARQELWDRHNMVLGCRRGYVHLDTGLITAPDPNLFVTMLASVSPSAGPPGLWLKVLDHWCGGDAELIRFLQQMCGYLLTGDTSEQKFFFLRGPSGTGKGTFAHVLYEIMKDHAVTGDERLLALGGRFSIDEALASARGARLYLFDELPRGLQVNDALVKRLTGESMVTARHLYQRRFDYLPTYKIVLLSNYDPNIPPGSDAIKRRLIVVPFEHTAEQIDPQLRLKLRDEYSQILNWMIKGTADWREHGFVLPRSVEAQGNEYFASQDTIGHFIEECCEVHPEARVASAELYLAWKTWASERGFAPETGTAFGTELGRRGYAQGWINRPRKVRARRGLRLRNPSPEKKDRNSRAPG